MSYDRPKHDWRLYEEKCREDHVQWLRSLTQIESFELCEDHHRLAHDQQQDDGTAQRLERQRWAEKLAIRQRVRTALVELDRMCHERTASPDVD